jgi:hypothetical protein
MPFLAVVLAIEQVIKYVSAGVTTAKQIDAAISAGKLQVQDAAGKVLAKEDVVAAVEKAQAQDLKTGDSAAENIEGRHPGGV